MTKKLWVIFILLVTIFTLASCENENTNEIYYGYESEFDDMINPAHYTDDGYTDEIVEFLYYAHQMDFYDPISTEDHVISTNFGSFGSLKGRAPNYEYHPAIDLKVDNNETIVNIYAVFDGLVKVYTDQAKYRDMLTLETEVRNDNGDLLGSILIIYAHIDVADDLLDNMNPDKQDVQKGDTLSMNLYEGTVGGPHLHFEIRYYLNTDDISGGYFEYYGSKMNFDLPSESPWEYGYWSSTNGIGFGNPKNH